MTKLPRPIRQTLENNEPDRATLERLWNGTQDRMAPRRWPRIAFAVMVPAAAAIALLVVWLRRDAEVARTPQPGSAVHLANGKALPPHAIVATAATVLALDDGSRIELGAGAALAARTNDASGTTFALERGRARFALTGARRVAWTIEMHGVRVVTSAAVFAAFSSDETVEVEVFDGEVLVKDRKLGAGQRVAIATAGKPEREREPEPEPGREPEPERKPEPELVVKPSVGHAPHAPVVSPRAPTVATPPGQPAASPWRALAADHKYAEAYEAIAKDGVVGTTRALATPEALLELADVARLSGHAAEALAPLDRVIAEFPEDRRAGLAAYTKARVLTDELHQSRRGAEAFAEAIALGLPEALGETAYLRLVETRRDSGDRAGAEAAAQQYERAFPAGKLRDKVSQALAK